MYSFLRWLLRLFFRLVFRWKVTGTANIPREGGVIIAANHVSLWDPPVIGCAMDRRISFMAKEELFAIPVFNWIIAKLGAFPVRRGAADRTAIRTAVAILEAGGVLGVFPEGTRSRTGKLGAAEPGVAMLALKTGAPIVPCAVVGTNKVLRQGQWLPRFEVRFGKPLQVAKGRADKEDVDRLTTSIMEEISNLLAEE
ncbi:1-acyl-sn-glycerol-3-phosphate acyltransferases [Thermosinus carboxydivorans Nor1]|uniref:1-acyl-sn-glycerol-3-phosphate acyltransferase n=1 Tax=Thermosinus carboxydivorans Nor1 TaxID=401526 RepID=A1HTW7_9FIRM|nr:lysophospholipid acyltransferase family protein [Thermosinus carboxydivorans]EAX46543.1 1-acyl-sn-glycerol-3-phosphate acyltransferases [Thermosinus carboxydivorans Nor1]